jgi:hypothetical protein
MRKSTLYAVVEGKGRETLQGILDKSGIYKNRKGSHTNHDQKRRVR